MTKAQLFCFPFSFHFWMGSGGSLGGLIYIDFTIFLDNK